jgi:hypothetical protein
LTVLPYIWSRASAPEAPRRPAKGSAIENLSGTGFYRASSSVISDISPRRIVGVALSG